MDELALHILDIVENSLSAESRRIRVLVEEDAAADLMRLVVEDDGRGMDGELLEAAKSPFATTRSTRSVGLGLPLLAQNAEAAGGGLTVDSRPGEGTLVEARMRLGHVDRPPLGDLESTLMMLLVGLGRCELQFRYRCDSGEFEFDTEEIRRQLDGVPLNHCAALGALRGMIREGLSEARKGAGAAAAPRPGN